MTAAVPTSIDALDDNAFRADREVAQAAGPALASMLIYLLMAAILFFTIRGMMLP